jgi:regulator of protease activity HflC (stomatin/prohibitin superfamily)
VALFILGIIVAVIAAIGFLATRGSEASIGGAFGGVIGLLVGLVMVVTSFVGTVPAASVGIPVSFGHVGSDMQPGFHIKAPWTSIKTESTRLQTYTMSSSPGEGAIKGDDSISVTSADIQSLTIDATVQYQIDPKRANDLYRTVGSVTNLENNVIRPIVRTALRDVFSRYSAVDASTTKRPQTANDVDAELRQQFSQHGVELVQVNIRNIGLPQGLIDANTNKVKAQTEAEQAQFKLQQAQIDAKTAVAAAQGQADANNVLNQSLNPNVLCAQFLAHMGDLKVPTGNPCGTSGTSTLNLVQSK